MSETVEVQAAFKIKWWSGEKCPHCAGTGEATEHQMCPHCGGTGDEHRALNTRDPYFVDGVIHEIYAIEHQTDAEAARTELKDFITGLIDTVRQEAYLDGLKRAVGLVDHAAKEGTSGHAWNAMADTLADEAAQVTAGASDLHLDDRIIEAFASQMRAKMAYSRLRKGRGGWQQVEPAVLSNMLHDHVRKGDPIDVANFCMMLLAKGATIAPPRLSPRDARQIEFADFVERCWGRDCRTSIKERAARVLEEAAELAQASEITEDFAMRVMKVVFSREIGEPFQELGGVAVTLLAYADAAGMSVDTAERTEIDRVLSKSIAHFKERGAAKNKLGISNAPT